MWWSPVVSRGIVTDALGEVSTLRAIRSSGFYRLWSGCDKQPKILAISTSGCFLTIFAILIHNEPIIERHNVTAYG